MNRFNLEADTAYSWINPEEFSQHKQWNPISIHSRWDSEWYLDIAQNGYSFKGAEKLSNIVFFPLYPLLTYIAAFFVGGSFILAGWMLSSLFLLLALFYLYRLTKEFHPRIDPYAPLLFLLIFPTAFFLNMAYTESLFLFLSVAAFYYGMKGNFLGAGIFGLLASVTRITGVLLFIPLLWEYARENDFKIRRMMSVKILPLFLVPAGTISFFLYHFIAFGDPLLFFKVEAWWGRAFNINKDHFLLFSNSAIANLLIDTLFIIFALVGSYFIFKRLRTSYVLYVLPTVLIALSTGTFMSIGRYLLVFFPLYILAASIKNEYVQKSWIFVSILLLALNIILLVNNYWAG